MMLSENTQAELDKIESTLQSLASLLSGDGLAAAQKPLLDRKIALLQGSGAIAQGENSIALGAGAILIQGNIHFSAPPDDPQEALALYRRVVANQTSNLPLRGIDVGASDPAINQQPIGLSNVYVALDTTSEREVHTEQYGKTRLNELYSLPISALDAVSANRRVVLLGDPGSGKSTFVNFLAHCLAIQKFEALNGWFQNEQELLPVVVILRDFARRLSRNLPVSAKPSHLWRFITQLLDGQNLGVTKPLQRALEKGKAFIFLDGLDEVPTAEQRRFIRDAIVAFSERYPECRYLVTCRVRSYQDPDLFLQDFPIYELAPFDAAKIDSFINAWYGELVRLRNITAEEADTQCQRLTETVRRPDLWRLAPNPLLLTVMALVHTHKGRLPDARALLYEDTIDILLWRWEQIKAGGQPNSPHLRQLLQDTGRSDVDLKRVLWALAFDAHSQTDELDDRDRLSDIGELKLQKAFAALNNGDLNWASQLIDLMNLRAGLLLERAPEIFTFPHRTFQEYLAGAHLATQANFAQLGNELAGRGTLWWESILLAAGKLVYLHGDMDKPLALVGELCPSRVDEEAQVAWRKVWLAGDILLEIGIQRVCDTNLGCDLLERVRLRLASLLRQGQLSSQERVRVGDTLAILGDPRFRADFWHLPDEHLWGFVHIPTGAFCMGSDTGKDVNAQSDETPQFDVFLSDYYIARYPVTVAQFRTFVESSGYKKAHPRSLQGLPNHPVAFVSWRDALEYCHWLNEQLRNTPPARFQMASDAEKLFLEKLKAGDLIVALPSEAEWEKAARGTLSFDDPVSGRLYTYPWGEEPNRNANIEHANVEMQIGKTSAVGCFPAGCSPYGILDLAGNVSEWTRSAYQPYPYQSEDGRNSLNDHGTPRVVRGGAFDYILESARSAFRNWNMTDNHHDSLGFRVAISPISPA